AAGKLGSGSLRTSFPMKKVSRLGQWEGPRQSSRGHKSLLAGLAQLPTLARIGGVLAATLALTPLAYFWGPPFPCRVGEVWAQDIQARVRFEVEDSAKTEDAQDEAVKRLPAEQRGNPRFCEEVRKAVALHPITDTFPPGTVLLQRNQRI